MSMNETIDKVFRFVKKNGLIPEGTHVLCSVSGGADSMAMLHILSENSELFGLGKVSVFHLNHNIRGEEADSDERFVREYCDERHISYYSFKLSSEESVGAGEDRLRYLRYHYLSEAADNAGADLIATGHTLSDQAETLLLNLGRGAGLKGMSGIPPLRDNIIRPILCLSRYDTENYCTHNSIDYRIDSTNLDDAYKRNYIRNHLLPVYGNAFDEIEEKLVSFTYVAREADQYLSSCGRELFENIRTGPSSVSTLQLNKQDPILIKYALMHFFKENDLKFDRMDIIRSAELINGSGRLQLKDGYIAEHYSNVFRIYKKELFSFESKLITGSNYFDYCKSVYVTLKDLQDIHISSDKIPNCDVIDYDKVVGDLILRNWRSGDIFSSYKRKNTKSLKKLFNEKKMAPNEKTHQMIISDDTGIVWLEGEGVSIDKAVTEETKKAYVVNTVLEECDD